MIEKILIDYPIHTPMAKQQTHVEMQLLTGGKAMMKPFNESFLLSGQQIWIFGVNRREMARGELIFHFIHFHGAPLKVDGIQQFATFHPPSGMPVDQFSLQLPLDHTDGFVHTGKQEFVFLVKRILLGYFRHKFYARIVAIDIHGKCSQLDEIDAITIFKGLHVGITECNTDNVAHACIIASSCPHPQDIVISPRDVPCMIVHECVHHDMRSRSTVVDIAQNMKLVDAESLNHSTKSNDEIISTAGGNDGLDDGTHIISLVLVFRVLMKKFLNNIGEIDRQRLAHLGTRIFTGNITADINKVMDGDMIPIYNVGLCLLHQLQLLLRIVNQSAKFTLLISTKCVTKKLMHFSSDVTRSILQDMLKRFIFSMNISQKVLSAFGQIENRTQVDNFRTGIRYRRKRL